MIIALDIGNTSVTCGIQQQNRILFFKSLPCDSIPKYVKNCAKSGESESINVIISSVVPKYTNFIKKSLSSIKRANIWVVGENIPVAIKHKYKNYNKLGIDRIVNIYGACRLYKTPLLVMDFGTAITADFISSKGVFCGGMIIPGPELSFRALISKAAKLPSQARLPKKRRSFLGQNTRECMESGILEGYGAMTEGLIHRFKSRYGKELHVLLTGGFASHLKPFVPSVDFIDPRHSIKSLCLIYKNFS